MKAACFAPRRDTYFDYFAVPSYAQLGSIVGKVVDQDGSNRGSSGTFERPALKSPAH